MPNRPHRSAGFSLVEILVALGVIAILSIILLPSLTGSRDSGKNTTATTTANTALLVAQSYYRTNQSYAGFSAAALVGLEPSLRVAGPDAVLEETGYDKADDKAVFVKVWPDVGTDVASPADDTADMVAVICVNSRGDALFCIQDNGKTGSTTYKTVRNGERVGWWTNDTPTNGTWTNKFN